MKIVYIAGLTHSGSTLLDMLLSCHSRIVGLGEVFQLVDPRFKSRHIPSAASILCSCGRYLLDCPLWSDNIASIKKHDERGFAWHYSRILTSVCSMYDEPIISDSSKSGEGLVCLFDSLPEIGIRMEDVFVVHIVKDARNYAVSQKKRYESNWFSELKYLNGWYKQNKFLKNTILSKTNNLMTIGYEELCFHTEFILKKICRFIGVDYELSMENIRNSAGHIGVGNPMRTHLKKSQRITYDSRWFINRSVCLKYALMPRISSCNKSMVYGNINRQLSKPGLFNPL